MILIGFFRNSAVVQCHHRAVDVLSGSRSRSPRSPPGAWRALYTAKLTETLVNSSWMVALMAVPIIAAFGIVYQGGPWFPLIAIAAFAPFFVLPTIVGSAVTLILVNVFPARRTRDILGVIAVLQRRDLVLFLRLMRPERLARPEGFQTFTASLMLCKHRPRPGCPASGQRARSWGG